MTARPDFPGASASVSAAILVGGRARRMHGLDKSTLDVDGLPILERQLAVLRQISDDLMIVTRPDSAPRVAHRLRDTLGRGDPLRRWSLPVP